MAACTKYPWTRGASARKKTKWGAYDCDAPTLEWAIGSIEADPSIDADTMDWADDISYAVHDIEDFFRIGLVPLDDFGRGKTALEEFLAYVQTEGAIGEITAAERERFEKALELFPSSRFMGTAADIARLDTLRSWLLTEFINACRLNGGRFERDSEMGRLNEILKQFIWYYIIDNPSLANIQEGQQRVLREIFVALEGILLDNYGSGGTTEPDARALRRLPSGLRHAVGIAKRTGDGYSLRQQIYRGLVDFMASLSDAAAYSLHATLRGEVRSGVLHWHSE